jgi:uncharacterized protein YjbJ (UPF0337 family)
MSGRKVDISGLADAVLEELEDYDQDVTDMLKDEVKKAAKETVAEIKETAPKLTGDYRKGWKSKVQYETADDIRMTVYNATEYPLTHLLEHGHAKAGGGRVAAIPHLKPAEEHLAEKLEDRVRVGIRNR